MYPGLKQNIFSFNCTNFGSVYTWYILYSILLLPCLGVYLSHSTDLYACSIKTYLCACMFACSVYMCVFVCAPECVYMCFHT